MVERGRTRGLTLPELLVSMGVFALLSVVLFAASQMGIRSFTAVQGRYGASAALRRATTALQKDIAHADSSFMQSALLGTGHGDILWFLSADDPDMNASSQERFQVNDAGRPEWRRNIIYYLARPTDHDRVSGGYTCVAGAGGLNDTICPHKFLIRMVVDGPDGPDGEEALLSEAEVKTYALQPPGYNLGGLLAPAEVEDVKLVSNDMLQFAVDGFSSGDRFIELSVAAARIQEAVKNVPALGTVSLIGHPVTTGIQLSLVPKNKE